MALAKTEGASVVDIDGNSALDVSGSYGVNVCGYEAYKKFITAGWETAKDKGSTSARSTRRLSRTSR